MTGHDRWKGVRIIDGTVLIDWLHQFPSVEAWLAERILGIESPAIDTFDRRWEVLRSYGEPPPLTASLFLKNRDQVRVRLDDVLSGQAARLRLETRYPDQGADFVTAHLAAMPADTRVDSTGRALFVSTADAWTRLSTLSTPHILISEAGLDLSGDAGTRLLQLAQRSGHRVIFSGLPGAIPDPSSLTLPLPRAEQIEEALLEAGHPRQGSRTLAERCAGNLASLKRMLLNLAAAPEWAEGPEAADLAIAMIIGSWSEAVDGDQDAVEGISGNQYGAWIERIRAHSLQAGTPLSLHNSVWTFGPRYEGWFALGPRIFRETLRRLSATTVSVLSETDPRLELSDDELFTASLRKIGPSHSPELREGLADAIALLGSHPTAMLSLEPGVATGTADAIVGELLATADWKRFASLDRVLPLLAEASPNAFLDSVDAAVRTRPSPFEVLFEKETSGLLGRTYISGTLWALETLAWEPAYLGRAIVTLGGLAAIDPGGSWTNRPAHSLTTILLPWMPQTMASREQRLSAIAALSREEPTVAWNVLLSLMPRQTQTTSGSRKAKWRAWVPDDWSGTVGLADYREEVSVLADRLVTLAGIDVGRLATLASHVDVLPAANRATLLAILTSDEVLQRDASSESPIWNALARLVHHHRVFADAEWALDQASLEMVEQALGLLEPRRLDLQSRRLFTERAVDLFDRKGEYAKQRDELEAKRDAAIRDVAVAGGGLPAVWEFAHSVETPWRVGFGYGLQAGSEVDPDVLPSALSSEDARTRDFGRGFALGRFSSGSWDWFDALPLKSWEPSQIAGLLAHLPFAPEAWQRAATHAGAAQDYWRLTPANPYGHKGDVSEAISPLIEAGRPFAALRVVHYVLVTESRLLVAQALEALQAGLSSGEARDQMSGYEVAEVFKALQSSDETPQDELIGLEWAYLPVLDEHSGTGPRRLEHRLANDPAAFAEIVRLTFKGRGGVEEDGRNPELAANGYRLLSEWSVPPGQQSDGSFDGQALTTWVRQATELCRAIQREAIALTMVGHVLRHVPADKNGLWIDEAAAVLLDGREADDLRDGYRTAEFNSRGAHFVNPTGEDEAELAKTYRDRGEALASHGFHRFAATLRTLAESYEIQSEQVRRRIW